MTIEKIAQEIITIIGDYRNDDGIQMTAQNIIDWASQFGAKEQLFILEELKEIFKKRYISKMKAEQFLKFSIQKLAVRNRHKINWRFIASEFFRGEHAGSPLRAYVVGANLRVRPLTTLKIYKTGSYFVTIPYL